MEELTIKKLEKEIEKLEMFYNVARKNHFSKLSYVIFEDVVSLKMKLFKLRGDK